VICSHDELNPATMSKLAAAAPAISIVTPCLNQGTTIRQAIESVANNDNPNIEHIIVDGGSTDDTLKIISEYGSVKLIIGDDDGPYDAINTGFSHARGEIFAWLNADDFYLPHALDVVGSVFGAFENIRWLTTTYPLTADPNGHITGAGMVACYSRKRALRPDSGRLNRQVPTLMQQESTLWRRSLWEETGAMIDTQYPLAADFELWLRFWRVTEPVAIDSPIACFRHHDAQRSRVHEAEYREDVEAALGRHGIRQAGLIRTLGRLAALSCRGLPQVLLQYCPFAAKQQVVSQNRRSGNWELNHRYVVPA
jgi:hypothetical protein